MEDGFIFCPRIPMLITNSKVVKVDKLTWRERLRALVFGRIEIVKITTTQAGKEFGESNYMFRFN
jgi:uncharacterized protein YhhL (DUF1145 family)